MIVPIRCFSCGAPIAQKWEEFKSRVEKGEDPKKVLDELGLKRYCCRSMFLGQVDLYEDIAPYRKD
jgi:DNA-directed RNA polymerase subunit N